MKESQVSSSHSAHQRERAIAKKGLVAKYVESSYQEKVCGRVVTHACYELAGYQLKGTGKLYTEKEALAYYA